MKYSKMLSYITKVLNEMSDTPVDVCLNTTMATAIEYWETLYEDRAPWLSHKKGIESAGIPGGIAAELARLVTLELQSQVADEKVNAIYQGVLTSLRVQTEYACALGGMALKPYPANGSVSVQFIRADCFFPVSFDAAGNITKAVFVDQTRAGKKIYTRLEIHTLLPGKLLVQNKAYSSGNDQVLGSEIALADVAHWAEIKPEDTFPAKKLPIGYFTIPLANTIDADSPLGVSVFSRADGLIKEADKRYSAMNWEIEGTQLAVHVAESLLKQNKDTGTTEYPAGKERLYRAVEYNTGAVDKPLLDTFSPEIRVEALTKAYQDQLRRIEFVCGLAYGTISDPQTTDKTAEEVRASKQRLYATVTDIQMALQNALTDLAHAIAFWLPGENKEPEVTFAWDDSIIVDSNALANRALLEKNAGIIDDVVYFMRVYGIKKDDAIALVKEIAQRKPEPSQTPDLFGGGA